jgi:hypothetical protein
MRKKISIAILLIFLFYVLPVYPLSSSIESFSKVRLSHGYLFKINYTTEEEWTDGLVFKLICSFSKGAELSFTSSGLSNIRRGWHKTEIQVPKAYRDRYGYITNYRLELYHNGILVSLKSM